MVVPALARNAPPSPRSTAIVDPRIGNHGSALTPDPLPKGGGLSAGWDCSPRLLGRGPFEGPPQSY